MSRAYHTSQTSSTPKIGMRLKLGRCAVASIEALDTRDVNATAAHWGSRKSGLPPSNCGPVLSVST
jgi:hypothetical protein